MTGGLGETNRTRDPRVAGSHPLTEFSPLANSESAESGLKVAGLHRRVALCFVDEYEIHERRARARGWILVCDVGWSCRTVLK